jgi:hypothetical protein
MVNNVIGVVNYVIAARPSLLNFMIADSQLKATITNDDPRLREQLRTAGAAPART